MHAATVRQWLAVHDGALARLLPGRSPGAAAADGPRDRYLAYEAVRALLEHTAERRPLILDRIEPKYGTVEHFYRLTADGEGALAIVRLLDESLYLSL